MLCACISRVRGRGGVWFARFLVGFAGGLVWVSVAVFGGCCGWVVGGGFGWCGGVCGWVYSLALTRSRLTDSRKTAHGSRLAGVRLLAVGVRVGGGVRPSNLIFLALIISRLWWGGILQPNGNRKRRTVCVRSLSLPQTFLRTPNTSVR